ncbi:MAG: hypothetical protein ACR2PA_10810 [Hyphomicrobiaceae bacterium]
MSRHDLLIGATIAIVAMQVATSPLAARTQAAAFTNTLNAQERRAFEAWYVAQISHDAALNGYWRKISARRSLRKKKKRARRALVDSDYVTTFPPKYNGPQLAKALYKRWLNFSRKETPTTKPSKPLPGVADYLASAKRHYNFVPERIPEIEFKRRYAREALSFGLSKEQVVRVFALETGGRGTADMQAGIHPITKRGKPISSALGYAQLLAANSINVMAKHGSKFVRRLEKMIKRERRPQRQAQLREKLRALRAMLRTAKSIPFSWSRQRALARTSRGMGLHPLNIDGDIGPWMQVIKLADIKRLAERKGRGGISSAELELMNLAGPGTGLEMMRKVARNKPTANFFARRGYYRNSIVRGRTSDGLIVALGQRMDQNIKNKGAQEFLAVFDELLAQRRQTSSTQ